MTTTYDAHTKVDRAMRFCSWAVLVILVVGTFWGPLTPWTTGFLSVWFLRCLRLPRGFVFIYVVNFFVAFSLLHNLHLPAGSHLGWAAAAALFGSVPFYLDRLISPRSTTFLSTLILPLLATAINYLAELTCPEQIYEQIALGHGQGRNVVLGWAARGVGGVGVGFFALWFAAALNWISESSSAKSKLRKWVGYTALATAIVVIVGAITGIGHSNGNIDLASNLVLALICVFLAAIIGAWIWRTEKEAKEWPRADLIAILQSPKDGSDLRFIRDNQGEALVGKAGERFPIVDGIPNFAPKSEVKGLNSKFDRLYELFGGFYDEATRVEAMLKNGDENAIRQGWMQCVHVNPQDWVLETSVGSAGNLKLLPKDACYFGLDLSREMLRRGSYNLKRTGMKAELLQGNAEALPFKDEIFDVVYHVGSINFFSDPARAIREMIRVAKPGTQILIADESEGDEMSQMAARVPFEMQEIHAQNVCNGNAYIITFRKPLSCRPPVSAGGELVLR